MAWHRLEFFKSADGEISINFEDSMSGQDVYLVVDPGGRVRRKDYDEDADDFVFEATNLYDELIDILERPIVSEDD